MAITYFKGDKAAYTVSDLYPRVCERCGIDEDDPREPQACAAVDSDSPYHRFPEREQCPSCKKYGVLSNEEEHSVLFDEPLCQTCRQAEFEDSRMDASDRAYERARANGWAD